MNRRSLLAMRSGLIPALLTVVFFHPLHAEPAAEQKRAVTLSFDGNAVVVEGATPDSQVVLFGVAREPREYVTRTSTVATSVQSSPSGRARFELNRPVVSDSIYAAVDLRSGDFSVASPRLLPNFRPGQALRLKGAPALDFDGFDIDAQWVEAICVRPGQGAWQLSLMDGSIADSSPIAGTLQVNAGRMKKIGTASASPDKFRPHDVLIAIDPYEMTVVATAVNE